MRGFVGSVGARALWTWGPRGPAGPVCPFVWGVRVGRAGTFVELGRGRVGPKCERSSLTERGAAERWHPAWYQRWTGACVYSG